MPETMEYRCPSEDNLENIAGILIEKFPAKHVFAIYGDMGSGKTTFIKKICAILGVTDITSSPTFAIINEYITRTRQMVYHFDLYRINNIEEVFDIGYENYFFGDGYCFIEWPEKIENWLPEGCVKVLIKVDEKDNSRIFYF